MAPDKKTIETLGHFSSVMAEKSGAWDGNAPEWFPQPPEWLTLWEASEKAVEESD